jgi:hypothetical protein
MLNRARYLAAALSSEEKQARIPHQWTAGKVYDRLCADTHMAMANVKSHVWRGGSHALPSKVPTQPGDRHLGIKDKAVISIGKRMVHEDNVSTDGSFSSQLPPAVSELKKGTCSVRMADIEADIIPSTTTALHQGRLKSSLTHFV